MVSAGKWAVTRTVQGNPRAHVGERVNDDPPPIRNEMAPNPASNPHISGPKGHMGAQMGFTGSIFSMRSNLAGRCFAQNGPQDWENPLCQGFVAHFEPKNGQVFSVRTPSRGHQGPKTKKISQTCSFFGANTFFESVTKIKFSVFFQFFWVKVFLSNFSTCRDPSKNQ